MTYAQRIFKDTTEEGGLNKTLLYSNERRSEFMIKINLARILTMILALWLAAALFLSGCSAPAEINTESEPKKSMQEGMPSSEAVGGAETNEPYVGEINVRGNTTGNIKNGGYATMQGDWIYYAGSDGIYRMKQDGSGNKKICNDKAMYLNVQGDWLYYKNMTKGNDYEKAFKIKTNGGGRTLFLDREANFLTIINDAVYVYSYDDDFKSRLRVAKQDGTELTKIKTTLSLVTMLVDEQCFIGVEDTYGPGDIHMYLMDGSYIDIKELFGDIMVTSTPRVLDILDGWIYLTKSAVKSASAIESGLYRIKTDGSSIEQVKEEPGYYANANFSEGWMYFANTRADSALFKLRLDGASVPFDGTDETEISGDSAANIQVVGDWVFYKCKEDSKWYRIKTNGTDKTLLP